MMTLPSPSEIIASRKALAKRTDITDYDRAQQEACLDILDKRNDQFAQFLIDEANK